MSNVEILGLAGVAVLAVFLLVRALMGKTAKAEPESAGEIAGE